MRKPVSASAIERLLPDCAHQWRKANPEADRPTFEEAEEIAKELLFEPSPQNNPRILPRIAWAERNWPKLATSIRKKPDRILDSGEPENIVWEFFTTRWIRNEPDLALNIYFISKAKSHSDYWEALEQIETRYHRNGQPLPTALAEWRADVNEGKQTKPKRKRGRPNENSSRNMRIVHCILVLEFLGMNPTRNDATELKESVCDVVDTVLEKSYKTIKGIWLGARCHKN